jgi:replicative DNA helicase
MAELRVLPGGLATEPERSATPEIPYDEPAELAIVASMWLDAALRAQARALLRPEHFYGRKPRTLFEAMSDLDAAGVAVDHVTLMTRLRETDRLKEFLPGGPSDVIARTAAVGNVGAYARAIRDAWRMRRLLAECQRWTAEAGTSRGGDRVPYGPAQALLERVTATASDLASDASFLGAQTSEQVVEEAFGYLRTQCENVLAGRHTGVPTGFGALTRQTTGLHAPDLILLGAVPSMGKTALLASIAVNAAEAGVGVAFFSLEMTARDIMLRLAGARAGVSMTQMRSGGYRARASELITALKHLQNLPIVWDGLTANDPTATIPDGEELMAKALRIKNEAKVKRRPPVGLIVVDYLQRIRPPRNAKSREEGVAANAKCMKLMATRLGAPVLCAAALNRQSSADGRKPEMRDLRESGAAEYEADCIWLLHREDYVHERKSSPSHVFTGDAEVIIAKARNGQTGSVMLKFEREFTRFHDAEEGYGQVSDWHERAP